MRFSKLSSSSLVLAFIIGIVLAGAVSVWATSIGTNIDVTGKLTVSGTTGTTTIASGQGFTVGSSQFVIQQTSGNVGIGTTTPWGLLSVNANNIGAGPQFTVGSSTKTDFVITNAGNVGIGTTTPGETFSTNGDALISSTATSTLFIHSEFGTRGGCIQLEGPASTTFRAYATTTGPLILESGTCQ